MEGPQFLIIKWLSLFTILKFILLWVEFNYQIP